MVALLALNPLARMASVAVTIFAPQALAEIYVNANFEFGFTIPPGVTVCRPDLYAPNHGASLRLAASCESLTRGRNEVGVFGNYNIPDEAKTTTELVAGLCRGKPDGPQKRQIGIFTECTPVTTKGMTRRSLFYLHRDPSAPPGDWTYYRIDAYSDRVHRRRIEAVLHGIVASFRVIPRPNAS